MDGPTRMVFFLVVNDTNSNKFLTWPQNVEINNQFNIASPKNWGELHHNTFFSSKNGNKACCSGFIIINIKAYGCSICTFIEDCVWQHINKNIDKVVLMCNSQYSCSIIKTVKSWTFSFSLMWPYSIKDYFVHVRGKGDHYLISLSVSGKCSNKDWDYE